MVDFPVRPQKGTRGVVQIDLGQLASSLNPDLVDPSLQFTESSASRPGAATPTTGPHRYGIYVPHDDASIVNIGAGVPDGSRIKDKGITGKTKTHIHWHTTEGAGRTMVALGGKTEEDALPTPFKTDALTDNTGYAMVTEGFAYHDSKSLHQLVSREGQIVVRAKTDNIRLHTDTKTIEIASNEDIALGSKRTITIVADTSAALGDNGYKQHFDKGYWDWNATKAKKDLLTLLDVAGTFQGMAVSYDKLDTIGDDGKWGFSKEKNDTAKLIVDFVKLISTVVRWAHSKDAPGQVKLAGENYGSLTGGIAASIYGNWSASVTSAVSASVLGGTASLKGICWTSVWAGLGVSVKTLTGKADLKSERGKASVFGKKDVSVTSETEKVKITGETAVQLSAKSGPAALHGTAAFCIGGMGPGYGVGGSEQGVHLGKFNSPKKYDDPKREKSEGVWVNTKALGATYKSGTMELSDNHFTLNAKKVEIKGNGEAKFDGSKVLIG